VTVLHPAQVPGAPGAISGPTGTNTTGSYTLSWGAASGTVSRYDLYENGALAYGGLTLSASLTGRLSGTYSYQVQACNSSGCGPLTAAFGVTVSLLLTDWLPPAALPQPPLVIPAQGWVGALPSTRRGR
jgi:hypothetical protein